MSEEDVRAVEPTEAVEAAEEQIEVTEAQVEEVKTELSEAEALAKEQGWKSPDEFEGGDKEPVSAEEFLRRGELFDKIKDLKQQYRRDTHRLEDQVRELTDMVHGERTRGYEQALKDIEYKRQEAVEIGDVDAFNSLDTEYQRIAREKHKLEQMPKQEAYVVNEAAEHFQTKHKDWFNSNTPENNSMVNQAVQIEQHLLKEKPYMTDEQRLLLVEKEMKDLYPHRFKNPKRTAPAKVEAPVATPAASVAQSTGGIKIKFSDLDERQQAAAERFMALDSSLTMEDYLRSVQEGMRIRHQL